MDDLRNLVAHLESDSSLLAPDQLPKRMEVLDLLDAYFDAYFPETPSPGSAAESSQSELTRHARSIHARLEAVNGELYEAIRNEIRSGSRPYTLLRWVQPGLPNRLAHDRVMGYDHPIGYDYLDELISEVFQFEEPDDRDIPREPEKVPYQPTPARQISSLIGWTALTSSDVFVDLGSGLGHVPMLVSSCTDARSIGVELEATYVERARQCAQRLNLNRVTFLHQDARAADLSSGTVFYLYTPFVGSILRTMLNLLRQEAATRRIRICSYGPCTSVLAEESWLVATASPHTDHITVFRSCV